MNTNDTDFSGDQQINIRTAVSNDAPAIAHVHVASWQSAYKGQLPDAILDNLSVERRQQYWQQEIHEGGTAVFVAEVAGQVVGFANVGASRDPDATKAVGEIYAIYLLATFWRQGIGKKMMQAGLNELVRRNCSSTMLWVLKSNQRTINFYTGMGFSLDGTDKVEQWGKFDIHEVRMVRPS